jgi:hypothetical protein
MPSDISSIDTTWEYVTLTQNERWQVILGTARIWVTDDPGEGVPTPPASLESGLIIKNFAIIELTSGDAIFYRRASAAPCTIARSKR